MADLEKFLKRLIGGFIRFTGLYRLIKWLIRKKATILLYHNPKLDILDGHLQYLKKHFNFITLDTLICAIYDKDWSLMPQNPLIITMDDGFKGNLELLRLFRKYGVKPTIYICSHIINTHRKFWFESEASNPHLYFKYDNAERLAELSQQYGFEPTKEYPTRQALNVAEIIKMSPYADFQSHSKLHSILPKCSDEDSFSEIKESKERLTEMLNTKISHFSYPNGDYSDREIRQLKKAGYKSARTCDIGWNHIHTDPFRLKAMGIADDSSINELISQLYGVSGFLRFAKHGSINGKHPQFT
jgi:peptidoglycan/xylan/chitin deacetylase (PgdA/CDA1 family)